MMPATRKRPSKRVTLRLPTALHRALKVRAARRDTTITAEIEAMLRAWLTERKEVTP
jgi:plasmid stability protein